MENLVYLQNVMSLGFFALGCVFLFLRMRGNRARKILAFVVLFWTLDYLIRILRINLLGESILIDDFFSPVALIIGSFLVITNIPFVYEIVRPGWLTWKRGFYLLLPWLFCSLFYLLTLFIRQEAIDKLHNFNDLKELIAHFNVWFRFVLFLQIFYYLFILHRVSFRYKYYYNQWCSENYSSMERLDISWLQYIAFGMLGISIGFTFILFNLGTWAYIFHQAAIQFVFAITLYNGLFHENPYPEQTFRKSLDEKEVLQGGSMEDGKKDGGFLDSLPGYKRTVEEWMQKAHPYLRPDFKLLDVSEVVPLNRSYLSRVFNEGFGMSFSQVVQHYRVEKAKELLASGNNLSIQEVARDSGFASASSFHAIFIKKTGFTPKAYRKIITEKIS